MPELFAHRSKFDISTTSLICLKAKNLSMTKKELTGSLEFSTEPFSSQEGSIFPLEIRFSKILCPHGLFCFYNMIIVDIIQRCSSQYLFGCLPILDGAHLLSTPRNP